MLNIVNIFRNTCVNMLRRVHPIQVAIILCVLVAIVAPSPSHATTILYNDKYLVAALQVVSGLCKCDAREYDKFTGSNEYYYDLIDIKYIQNHKLFYFSKISGSHLSLSEYYIVAVNTKTYNAIPIYSYNYNNRAIYNQCGVKNIDVPCFVEIGNLNKLIDSEGLIISDQNVYDYIHQLFSNLFLIKKGVIYDGLSDIESEINAYLIDYRYKQYSNTLVKYIIDNSEPLNVSKSDVIHNKATFVTWSSTNRRLLKWIITISDTGNIEILDIKNIDMEKTSRYTYYYLKRKNIRINRFVYHLYKLSLMPGFYSYF